MLMGSIIRYVFGHSLGGSLGFALVAANLLPPSYRGQVTVVGVGSPPVLVTNAVLGTAVVLVTTGAAAAAAEVAAMTPRTRTRTK